MLSEKSVSMFIGVITTIFVSFALISQNDGLLLTPLIQLILGYVTAHVLISGISAFLKKRKGIGLFFTFITLFLLSVIILNNTMTISGFIPVITLYILFGVPIGIIAMIAHRINTRNEM
ncbi:hypothetical protein NC661_04190 [Aquibacillus koreensis]|uniref:Uncharacterized protein n=1 Tax=Aquibacillus koreensis TaxID=279446 RepID=A0A9X3WGP9_9BACI|nr:hypothetical protein [Aquibacillus koreensis]MCT2534827.1 hypothetical protein [Aquibacillus koreensis]MDC3419562.1 hypothetical protein [Aquibacillus koreensis]